MAKRGPKRNKHQKARDLKRVSELRAEGKPLREIAPEVGLSHEQVRLDLKFLDQTLLSQAVENTEDIKRQLAAKFRFAQAEAVAAWHRSLTDLERVTEKLAKDGLEHTTVTEGRSGNPGHIRNLIKATEAEAKLFGIYEAPGEDATQAAKALTAALVNAIDAAIEEAEEANAASPQD